MLWMSARSAYSSYLRTVSVFPLHESALNQQNTGNMLFLQHKIADEEHPKKKKKRYLAHTLQIHALELASHGFIMLFGTKLLILKYKMQQTRFLLDLFQSRFHNAFLFFFFFAFDHHIKFDST